GRAAMRRVFAILGATVVLGVGVTAAVALGAGGSSKDSSTSTGAGAAPAKVWLCHHTGSWKHPYHLIHISTHAVAAHMRHGDVTPGTNNSCPTAQPAGAKTHGHANDKSDQPGKDDDKTETDDD